MKPFYEQGRYEGEVTDQGFVKARTGNVQFIIRFTVKGRIDPANPDNMFPVPAQYERTVYRALTEKTVEYFVGDMAGLGIEIASFTDLDPKNERGFVSLKGKIADFICSHETGMDGGLREKWGLGRPATAGKPVESIASAEVKSLDRLFGKHLKKAPATQVPTPRLQPVSATADSGGLEIGDEDIPF